MPNALLVTVGTSSIYNEGIGEVGGRNAGSLHSEVDLYRRDPHKNPGRWSTLRDDLVAEHIRYWQQNEAYTKNPEHFLQSAAELTSTYIWLTRPKEPVPIDRIILLATQTPDGIFAGAVVLGAMESEKYSIPVDKRNILVKPFLNLQSLKRTAPRICEIVEDNALGNNIYLNLTGGYKSVAILAAQNARLHSWNLFQHYIGEMAGHDLYSVPMTDDGFVSG